MNHYPLFADLNGRPVLLAGAGKVAERKAESLLQAGAAVRVVARELNPVFQKWADEGKIEWLGSEFHEDDLDDVFFAVAATDDYAFNRRIFQAAERRALFPAAELIRSEPNGSQSSRKAAAKTKR